MTLTDLSPVLIGLVLLTVVIVRQQRWRTRGARPVWRGGLALAVLGVLLLAQDVATPYSLTRADLLFGGVSLAATVAAGVLMGRVTIFRPSGRGTEYRLPAVGMLIWAVVIGLRVAETVGAHDAGAAVASSTAFLLVSLGVNRFVSGLVVEARLPRTLPVAVPVP